ncbi:uncharacterized protein TNCV_1634561 [Trichonephila clavipes]|nr:uncharacterized protein TNCV_1634561 [Trichonephila clavipes]
MSSAGYSTSPVHWSRWSPSILAWPQSGQASLSATSSQWSYTPKKSCPVVRRKRATASALSRCLGIGPTVVRVSHGFPRLLNVWVKRSIFVKECGNNALYSFEGQEDFRLIRLDSLCGFFWSALSFPGILA